MIAFLDVRGVSRSDVSYEFDMPDWARIWRSVMTSGSVLFVRSDYVQSFKDWFSGCSKIRRNSYGLWESGLRGDFVSILVYETGFYSS